MMCRFHLITSCSSVVNQKFARLRSLDLSIGSAEAFDGSEDVIGGLGPFEGLGIGVVMTDEVHDVGAQSLDAAIDAAPDLLVGDEGEEALDLIEPGRAGGRRPTGLPHKYAKRHAAQAWSAWGGGPIDLHATARLSPGMPSCLRGWLHCDPAHERSSRQLVQGAAQSLAKNDPAQSGARSPRVPPARDTARTAALPKI